MLEKVKDDLRITWDDEDARLLGMIERAKADIDELMGVGLDYDEPGPALTLMLNRVRYDYNNALEYFEDNFHSEIVRLQLQVGVKELEKDAAP